MKNYLNGYIQIRDQRPTVEHPEYVVHRSVFPVLCDKPTEGNESQPQEQTF